MSQKARVALAGARPYVAAAVNTGGGTRAFSVLKLIDQALEELRPESERAKPAASAPSAGEWEPPGGWREAPEDTDAA